VLIASFFSAEMQGYYYTFSSVLAIQVFAELGLGTVLISYASHEWSKLAFDRKRRITGDADALSRLTSLGRFALSWYLIAGGIATLVLGLGGGIFFSTAGEPAFQWRGPWIVLCLTMGLNLLAVPVWALLEGCNQVSEVYTYRFIQLVVSSLSAWVAVALGAGLWVASITSVAGLLVVPVTIGPRYGGFLGTILLRRPKGSHLNWRLDILPMQWRIALSWVGGYLIFFLFTPVLFHYQGPVVAGQMGMTLAFTNALMSIASSLVLPRAPLFGMLIAQRNYGELDKAFWRLTATVVSVTVAGALGVWTLVMALNLIHHPFANRLLPPSTTSYLLLATIIVSASLPMATYLRAHKKEPLSILSLLSGIATAIVVVILGKYYSSDGVAIGYLVVMAAVTPFVALIWHRRRAEWHAPGLSLSQSS